VLEDRIQLSAHTSKVDGSRRLHFNLLVFTRELVNHIALALRGRWFRFGYACVSFGAPLSLRAYVKERGIDFRTMDQETRFAEVERLAGILMDKVGKVVPALPVALVATALLEARAPLSMLELKSNVLALSRRLEAAGAHVYIPRGDQDYAIDVGLRMLRLRHLVAENADGLFSAEPTEIPLLQYYANSIAHLFPAQIAAQAAE
jgi:glycerol-3-phosphate O-acyltransferase